MKKKIVLSIVLSMAVILFLFPGAAKDKKKFSRHTAGPADGKTGTVLRFQGRTAKSGITGAKSVTAPNTNGPASNLARNTSGSGFPHPTESDRGWGGGSSQWEIVDGIRSYSEWYHGLAFTGGTSGWAGEACGRRQATINFGEPKTFNRVLVWHHGSEHIPNTYKIQYWDGVNWLDLFSTTDGHSFLKYPSTTPQNWWEAWATPTENIFPPVTSSKIRMTLHNCDITHGWLYEIEVYNDTISVIFPNGGEEIEAGSGQTITWTSTDAVDNVRIEYSTDNGGNWTDIVSSTENDGAHPWTIPDEASTQCLIRVSDANNSIISDVGDGVFSIVSFPAPERAALIALYNNTNGDSWFNNSGWKTPPLHTDGFAMPGTEALWYGITCGPGNNTVTGISLNNNNLSGALPAELGNLSNLLDLHLMSNHLTGDIPAELGNLGKLRFLRLSRNRITGRIPPQLGNLSKLELLFLGFNRLTGGLPQEIVNLTSLEVLSVYANALTGSIPTGLMGHPRLADINIACNALYTDNETLRTFFNRRAPGWESTQVTAPGGMSVEALSESSVRLSWTPKIFASSVGGYRVYYGTNPGETTALFGTTADKTVSSMIITGLNPGTMYNFSIRTRTAPHEGNQNTVDSDFGTEVSVSTAPAPVGIPAAERAALIAFYNSTNGDAWTGNNGWKTPPLHSDGFSMPGTENQWQGIACNFENTTVEGIELNDNNLTGTLPPELGNLPNLQKLDLCDNTLTGSIPPELGNLTNLRELLVWSNQLTGTIPPELGNLTNVWILSFRNNQLTGTIPPELGNLGNLQHLWLSANQLTGSIPPELGNLSNLLGLYLEFNQLTGVPSALGNLTNLQQLLLSMNGFTSIPPEFENLTNLMDLQMGRNQLTGNIPPGLGNLVNLKGLSFNDNQLTGSIPPELGNLSQLNLLALYRNQLTGSIPPELGNLTALLGLGLNRNRLSGEIPTTLINMVNLSGSDIGYNALYTDDTTLRAFLNAAAPGWEGSQTVAPSDVAATALTETTVRVSWTPIAYTTGEGGYRVFYGTAPGGPYTLFGTTPDKTVSSLTVTGLTTGTTYYFVVRTRTDDNLVDSNYSAEVSATPVVVSTITVTSPNGGENWAAGFVQAITWNVSNVNGTLKITLMKDGAVLGTIASGLDASSGSYSWTVGQYTGGTVSEGSGYTVKIKEQGTTVSDTGDAAFFIYTPPTITVTSPNGGESWVSGSIQNITWDATNVSNTIKITLMKDGVVVGTVAGGLDPSSGTYSWTVGQYTGGTASPGFGYTVKIKEQGTTVVDTGDTPFTIE